MNQSNGNGYINDIFKVGKTNYIEKNEPPIFNTRTTNSLQGIIQETPMSRMFFSNGNIDGLQKTIRYKINQETNKTISINARSTITNNYSIESVLSKEIGIYKELKII